MEGKSQEALKEEREKEGGRSECRSVIDRIGAQAPRESGQTSTWSQMTRKLGEPIDEGTQMTAATAAGAPSGKLEWHAIDWRAVAQNARRLQARIVKATLAGKRGKVKALQRLLTHSFSAKAEAVRRVTENRGKHTAGIDGETWNTPQQKAQAIGKLGRRRGYKPTPLRRVHIPKKNGKMRPLSIPSMLDRAQQALYQQALDPVVESILDPNSYGFRRGRSTADAIEMCFNALARKGAAGWVLEGDLEKCFDTINHEWICANAPMDKRMLTAWLKAGYVEAKTLHPTEQGTPQGGIVSPTLCNVTLNGLEKMLMSDYARGTAKGRRAKVHVIVYADDFIITGSSKELLEDEIKPKVQAFMQERGLRMSEEKTSITAITEGFDFLGQNIRKYKGKLIIKPAKKNYAGFIKKVRSTVKDLATAPTAAVISQLNPIIRGWTQYHRHVCSKKTFEKADRDIFYCLWRWAKRRHPKKSKHWVARKYFMPPNGQKWVLNANIQTKEGIQKNIRLIRASKMPIKRHTKIRGEANPYDPAWEHYFELRWQHHMQEKVGWRYDEHLLWQQQGGKCPRCQQDLTEERGWEIHHIIWKVHGGTDNTSNLELLHPNCHRQLHSQDSQYVPGQTHQDDLIEA